jgi:hypothetical protein
MSVRVFHLIIFSLFFFSSAAVSSGFDGLPIFGKWSGKSKTGQIIELIIQAEEMSIECSISCKGIVELEHSHPIKIKGYFRSLFNSNGFRYIPYEAGEDDLLVLHHIDGDTIDVYAGGMSELLVRLKSVERKPSINKEWGWNQNIHQFWGSWEAKNLFDKPSKKILSSTVFIASEELPDVDGGEDIIEAHTNEVTYFTAREKELSNILFLTVLGQSNPIRFELINSKLIQYHGGKTNKYASYDRARR